LDSKISTPLAKPEGFNEIGRGKEKKGPREGVFPKRKRNKARRRGLTGEVLEKRSIMLVSEGKDYE